MDAEPTYIELACARMKAGKSEGLGESNISVPIE